MSERRRYFILRLLAYAIPLLLVVYVLSVGPAEVFLQDPNEGIVNRDYVIMTNRFYAPLSYVVNKYALVENLVIKYIDFCCSFV